MNFNSLGFFAFFAVAYGLFLLVRRRVRARNAFLLAASYVFYASWDYRFLSLIVLSTLVDYGVGRALDVREISEEPPRRTRRDRLLLFASLATNLGILGVFKYFDFFADGLAALLGALGLEVGVARLEVVLPVGISFYTFQTISYTVDLYRGRVTTERNLLTFAVFVAFFPQLVAGPIERARRLLGQFRTVRPLDRRAVYLGAYLVLWGLFKKVVIADNVGPIADSVFASEAPTGLDVVVGVYAFAVQIYCDFSAYSDIARGLAFLMGFELVLNFDLPYLATNPSEFWRRWHISLSTWLRDYLYIPLGGNRLGAGRTYANLMTTMVLGGLWHGAAWTFVAWGAYHGLLLVAHRLAADRLARLAARLAVRPAARAAWFVARVVVSFQLVCLGWLLFRAESLPQVGAMLGALADLAPLRTSAIGDDGEIPILIASLGGLFAYQAAQYISHDHHLPFRWPGRVRAGFYALLVLLILLFGASDDTAFIYFQF